MLTAAQPLRKEKAKASVQCVLCEFVMSKLEDMLTKNSTQVR